VSCNTIQCAAVSCSVLQCVAKRCSALQCIAVSCDKFQCITVCCSLLQYVAVCYSELYCSVAATFTNTRHHATWVCSAKVVTDNNCCIASQRVAASGSELQRVAMSCNDYCCGRTYAYVCCDAVWRGPNDTMYVLEKEQQSVKGEMIVSRSNTLQ